MYLCQGWCNVSCNDCPASMPQLLRTLQPRKRCAGSHPVWTPQPSLSLTVFSHNSVIDKSSWYGNAQILVVPVTTTCLMPDCKCSIYIPKALTCISSIRTGTIAVSALHDRCVWPEGRWLIWDSLAGIVKSVVPRVRMTVPSRRPSVAIRRRRNVLAEPSNRFDAKRVWSCQSRMDLQRHGRMSRPQRTQRRPGFSQRAGRQCPAMGRRSVCTTRLHPIRRQRAIITSRANESQECQRMWLRSSNRG